MSEAIKVPALGKVESVLLIGGVIVAAYLIYRLYNASSGIKKTVTDNLTKAGGVVKDAVNDISVAASKTRTSIFGASDAPIEDQAAAETARLARQEMNARTGDVNVPDVTRDPLLDAYGGLAMNDPEDTAAVQQVAMSPDASGLLSNNGYAA